MISDHELLNYARQAQATESYAPYSRFYVGAAILTENQKIFTSGNIENASFGLSVCAERIAVFKAIGAGERELLAIAVTAQSTGYTYPCGACLQVLSEFAPEIKVIVTNENNQYRQYYLKQLLPYSFLWQQED